MKEMRYLFNRSGGMFRCLLLLITLLCAYSAISDEIDLLSDTSSVRYAPYPREKDPFIAGLLSWFMMGVGQIYVQEYTKGSLFIGADLVDKASLILLISHINNKYSPSEAGLISVNWGDFTTGTKALIISYIGFSLGLRLYCVIDAFQSAQRYNERYFPKENREGLSFGINGESITFSYSFQLNK
jgi:hypothetical protein